MRKLLPALFGLLLLAAPAAVQGQSGSGDNFDYSINPANTNTITITNYTGPGGAVTIPTNINNLLVTGIGNGEESVFAGTGVTSVTIPGSVTSIGAIAFLACDSLTSITIPNSVTSIGYGAFLACDSLAGITVGNGVTSILDYAFAYCPSLTIVYFEGNAPTADSTVFHEDNNATVYYLTGATGWGSTFAGLPAWPTTPQAQFLYTTNAGTITVLGYYGPDGAVFIPPIINDLPVTSIGNNGLNGWSSVTNVTIPGSVTNLYGGAFWNYYRLTSVYFEGNAPTTGSAVFLATPATVYYLPCTSGWSSSFAGLPTMPWWQVLLSYTTNAGAITITGCSELCGTVAVSLPASINGLPVTSLGANVFENFTNLTSVTIPNSVTSIGEAAFQDCTSLTYVTIGSGVTNIAPFAFTNCPGLAIVYFEGDVPTADSTVFSGDNELMVYYATGATGWSSNFAGFPTVPATPQAQFSYTTNAGAITITGYTGSSGAVFITPIINNLPVTSIGEYAFYGCISPTNVTIPGRVTNIVEMAFAGCASLTAIMVDPRNSSYGSLNGVLCDESQTTLVAYPGGLAGNYTIPGGVTSIGAYAFSFCSLTSVTIPGGVTSIGDNAFYECTNLTNATIGNGVASIGGDVFFGCTRLAGITIPGSVTSIGDEAFYACSGLTGVYFTGNAPAADSSVFASDASLTVYYLPGTTGWGDFSANTGLTPVLWNPLFQASSTSFGVQSNQFGFIITNTAKITVMVEACTNLASPVWTPLQTVTLTNGSFSFSDPQWTNYPARYYGLGLP
jgi:hypothetical protein